MTNEALATRAQVGDKAALNQLWEQNQGLLIKLFSRYFPLCQRYRCETDDLLQCGFFAIQRAAKAYDPAKGYKFTSYLHHHVQLEAHEVFCLRGKPRPEEVSGSTLVGDDEGTELLELIPDESAVAAFERTVEDVYTQQLHDVLEAGLERLPARRAEVIRAGYWDGLSSLQVGARLGISRSRVRQLMREGYMHLLRTPGLAAWREDIISSAARKVGLGRFRHTRQSSVEWAVERLEDKGLLAAGAAPL